MNCPECRWQGRAIRAYKPRPSAKRVLICPACFCQVARYNPPPRRKPKLRGYTGAVD